MLRHIFAFSTVALTLAASAGQPIKVVLVGESTVNDEGGPRIPRFVRGGRTGGQPGAQRTQMEELSRRRHVGQSAAGESGLRADPVRAQRPAGERSGAPRLTSQVRFLVRTLFAVLES